MMDERKTKEIEEKRELPWGDPDLDHDMPRFRKIPEAHFPKYGYEDRKFFQQLPDTPNMIGSLGFGNAMFIALAFGCLVAWITRKIQNASDGPQYDNLLKNFEK